MIGIWNRRELLITMEMKRQSEIRNILSQNEIEYVIKTKNLQASPLWGNTRERVGTFGINHGYSYEYKIYVH